jgi:hypothetical protein
MDVVPFLQLVFDNSLPVPTAETSLFPLVQVIFFVVIVASIGMVDECAAEHVDADLVDHSFGDRNIASSTSFRAAENVGIMMEM